MATLTAAQIKGYAKDAGFAGDDLDIAVAVALAESGGRTDAYNGKGRDRSYGLWQINMYGNMGPARQREFGLASFDDLKQPDVNAKAAYKIWKSQGWQRGWTTYSSGAYKTHLDAAKATSGTAPRDGIEDKISDAAGKLNPVAGVGEAINSFGSTIFKGVTNVAGVGIAIALLLAGIALLIVSSKGAQKAVSVAANVVPGGAAAKGALRKVTK